MKPPCDLYYYIFKGPEKDNTGVNDAKMLCRDDETWVQTEPRFKGLGESSDTFECGTDQNGDALCVCGLQTLVQKRQSDGKDFACQHQLRGSLW